jgi:hypothetical protein
VWQWTVTPLRPGVHVLTLCLSVDVNTPDGPQTSPATCTLQRPVKVTNAPAFLAAGLLGSTSPWVLGGLASLLALAAAAGAGVSVLRRRARNP